ncbi:MAG: hypothetical protein LBP87_13700, partial [Planctomycetaceae bacterium]|nr:hypothetical protein [Planctomycetaceae bacterium]
KVFAARGKQLQPQTIHNALTPIFNERTEDMIPTIFDELRAEGEARGRVEGEARGEARGEVRGKTEFGRNAVLSVLRKKFTRIPKKIETSIRRMNDPTALESLVIEAATCQTLHEFSEVMQ